MSADHKLLGTDLDKTAPIPPPTTLAPCPFCGCDGAELELQWASSWWAYISCANCNATGPHANSKGTDDLTVAAKAWNERPA